MALPIKNDKWQINFNSPGELVLSTANKYINKNIDVSVEFNIWDGSTTERAKTFSLDTSTLDSTAILG